MTTQLALFDYGALDSETRIVVQQRTTEIKALMKRAASDIIEIGQKLIEVKARLGHGHFGGWLESEFEWHRNTANNFMRVAEKFTNFVNLDGFAPSALYLLAAPSTPETARNEAIERAEAGEAITHQAAREIADRHKSLTEEPLTPYEQGIAEVYERQIVEAEYDPRETQRRQQIQIITGSSESNEWYTPAHVIELARDVLGGIDLDPASSTEANETVKALSYCTIEEDGYSQPWGDTENPTRVWLNPPYGKEDGERETNAMRWSRKLISEYNAGRVDSAILLVKAALGYEWFEQLWYDYPTCLLRKRLSFVRPDGSGDGQAKHATALIYLGKDVDHFRSAFRSIGRVILPEE
jgi:hypothetical protein